MGQKIRYKVKKHEWEKEFARAPTSKEVLRQVIVSKVSYLQPKAMYELLQEVVDDYGTITERTLYRHLEELKNNGVVKSVYNWELDIPSYLRCGRLRKRKPKNDNIGKKAA